MNSTNMDVDMDSNGGNVALHEQEKIIKLHPVSSSSRRIRRTNHQQEEEATRI